MELWDDGESATITALFELPGLGPDQVLLDVVDGRLVVQGERRPLRLSAANPERVQTSTETSGSSQIRELKYGTFRRAISVPVGCTVSLFAFNACVSRRIESLTGTPSTDRPFGRYARARNAVGFLAALSRPLRSSAERRFRCPCRFLRQFHRPDAFWRERRVSFFLLAIYNTPPFIPILSLEFSCVLPLYTILLYTPLSWSRGHRDASRDGDIV